MLFAIKNMAERVIVPPGRVAEHGRRVIVDLARAVDVLWDRRLLSSVDGQLCRLMSTRWRSCLGIGGWDNGADQRYNAAAMGDVELPQIVGDGEIDPGDRTGLLGLTDSALAEVLALRGQQRFRGTQILEWVYGRGAASFDEMTNLPKGLRAELAEALDVYQSQVIRRSESRDGTVKLLLRWPGGATSECVLIPDGERRTACISTQVGCPVGCKFCASGLDGLERDLTAAQIVEQLMRVAQLCQPQRVSNVVFMGLGEPLANYAATVTAVRIINASWGPNVGARKITVSTVGLPSQMRRLASEGLQITLALSVHAPTDELRRELIPWAKSVTLDELVAAGREYFDVTGREVTLEYLLLGGVNDQPQHARQLATLSQRLRSHVNLIPYNPVPSLPYRRPSDRALQDFLAALRGAGVNAHLRTSRGLDVDAACGQLRRRAAAGSATV